MNPKFQKILSRGFVVLLFLALFPSGAYPVAAAPGDISRVSVDSNGVQSNNGGARPAISPDGRFVVFESGATNWDIPGTGGLFIRDLQTGQTTRVCADGEAAVVSSGGRFVAFTAFITGGTMDMYDVFVCDLQTGVKTQVSVDSSGVPGNDSSDGPAISDDGRFIAFGSAASNLVGNDTNGTSDVFVHDMQTGITERISVASDGSEANAGSGDASISADGRIVVFSSSATNLVAGDANGKSDIFARDRLTGTTTRVSVNSSGMEADNGASDASVSGNGRYVSFSSTSGNLINWDTMGFEYVYVHDRQTGITTIASVTSSGYQMIGHSEQSVISADGRYVAFQWDDKGDGMAIFVIEVHDLLTGMTSSVVGGHGSGEGWSGSPSISADGRFIAFSSGQILVNDDTNSATDAYLREMAYPQDINPSVSSVQAPFDHYPTPLSVIFRVTFSEIVTGVTADDFSLTMGGGVSGATITSVTGSGSSSTSIGSEYRVTVNTGTGDGTLRLDVIDNDSIVDIALNPLGGVGAGNGNFTTGEVYIVDKNIPAVISSTRVDPNPASGAYVNFAVTFSEDVTGVDIHDFVAYTLGNIIGATVSEVTGSGKYYNVKVSTGSGEGSLELNVIDDDSIRDVDNHPIGGDGTANGTFTHGEEYTINRIPAVFSILRADPSPTTADAINFVITFSEAVGGVDMSDFTLTTTGDISGATITGIDGPIPGTTFNIAVSTGSGSGTIRLDVIDNDSVTDSGGLPLGGAGLGNGNYTAGDIYTIPRAIPTPPTILTETFRSNGTNDGWVLESKEDSNVGGSVNSTAKTFNLGDDLKDRQYRTILHFPTSYLPDNVIITRVILMIKGQGAVGTDPFATHQNIQIDICNCVFGTSTFFGLRSLQPLDFQAAASRDAVGIIVNNPVGGWYWSTLDGTAFPYISLTGVTQLRLRFQLDDNDDLGDDYMKFLSGNTPAQGDRPQLMVEYYVP